MRLPIQLTKESRQPIYDQIEQQLKALIAGGHIPSGAALPSIRVLSKDLEVSVITTRRAYQNLEATGFIKTVQGKGTFVQEIDDSTQEETREAAIDRILRDALQQVLQYDNNFIMISERFDKLLKEIEEDAK